jgi:hypothetical protein
VKITARRVRIVIIALTLLLAAGAAVYHKAKTFS